MKKAIASIIALLVVLTALPLTAYAGEIEPEYQPDFRFIYIGIDDEEDPQIYRVLYEGVVDNTAVDGAVYDSDTNTLTVTNVDLPDYTLEFGGMGSDFKLIVSGECAFSDITVYSWAGPCSVYIDGEGKLTLNEQKTRPRGFTAYAAGMNDTITFGEDVTVEMYGEKCAFTVFYTGIDKVEDAIFFNAPHTSEPVLKAFQDQYFQSDAISGYYVDPFDNLDGYWMGYLATVADDPDGVYTAAYSYTTDAYGVITDEFYVLYKYVYSEEYGMYFYDVDYDSDNFYGTSIVTMEEYENGAMEFVEGEYGDYVGLYNSEDFSRATNYSLFKDNNSQYYAVGDEYDVFSDTFVTVVAQYERITDIGSDEHPEYLLTLTDVDPETLEYVEDSDIINGYYIGHSDIGMYNLGNLVYSKENPGEVYTASPYYDDEEPEVNKYEVNHYLLASVGNDSYWLRDYDFNKDVDELWLRGRIILSEDEFNEKYYYATDEFENPLYLYNMRDVVFDEHFKLYLDDKENKYGMYNYNGIEYYFIASPFDGALEGMYWLTLDEDVDPTTLTQSGRMVYEEYVYHHIYIESDYFGYNVGSASEEKLLGDVDGDGVVTILDATAIQRKLADMEVEAYDAQAADVDSADGATVLDVTAIQKYLADLEIAYPIGMLMN